MKRLDRQKAAAEAVSRYVLTCWISSTGRVRIGAFWGSLVMVARESDTSCPKAESILVLELAVSDDESSVGWREREEPKLRERRKKPMAHKKRCPALTSRFLFSLLGVFVLSQTKRTYICTSTVEDTWSE